MQLKSVVKPCNIDKMAHISFWTRISRRLLPELLGIFCAKRTKNFSQIIVCRSMKPTVLWSWKEVPRLEL